MSGVRCQKKPVIVDAIQWTGQNMDAVRAWKAALDPRAQYTFDFTGDDTLYIDDGFGAIQRVTQMDWIVFSPRQEFYAHRPEVFAEVYTILGATKADA